MENPIQDEFGVPMNEWFEFDPPEEWADICAQWQTKEPQERLLRHQRPHLTQLLHILQHKHSCAADTSPTGSGKTFTEYAYAALAGLKVLAVCPNSVSIKHQRVAELFGVELVCTEMEEKELKLLEKGKPVRNTVTIERLRGSSAWPISHPFLERITTQTERGDEQVDYQVTQRFKDLVDEGVLVLIDEVHKCKNATSQYRAARALVAYIVKHNQEQAQKLTAGEMALEQLTDLSRVLIMSATPADKVQHSCNLVQLLGVVSDPKMYQVTQEGGRFTTRATGYQELYQLCLRWNPVTTRKYAIRAKTSKKIVETYTYELFSKVLRNFLVSQMEAPDIPFERDVKNGFYQLEPEEMELFVQGQTMLQVATQFDARTGQVELTQDSFALMTPALMKMNKAKRGAMARAALADLRANPQTKVIILTKYISDAEWIVEYLEMFSPRIYHGKMSMMDRTLTVSAFQHPSEDCRVFVGQIQASGESIDLDDQDGNWPRKMYIMPCFEFIPQVQALGRFWRSSTRSDVVARFVYARDGVHELTYEVNIMDALARKKAVTNNLLGIDGSLLFPGNLEQDVEMN